MPLFLNSFLTSLDHLFSGGQELLLSVDDFLWILVVKPKVHLKGKEWVSSSTYQRPHTCNAGVFLSFVCISSHERNKISGLINNRVSEWYNEFWYCVFAA